MGMRIFGRGMEVEGGKVVVVVVKIKKKKKKKQSPF